MFGALGAGKEAARIKTNQQRRHCMSKEIILGIIRHVLTAAGGVLVTKGLADTAGVESAVGALVTLAGFIWSVLAKRQTSDQ